MLLQFLDTFAAFATLAVIAVASFAAVVQLRHLRASNQLSAMLTILHYSQDPIELERRAFVLNELAARLEDPGFRAGLMEQPVDPKAHVELKVCDFFEQVGNFVKRGLIDENAYLDTACDFIVMMWDRLEPAIAIMRRNRDETVYDNFEYLTARSRLWIAKHPRGNYPQGTDRIAVTDRWLTIDRASPNRV